MLSAAQMGQMSRLLEEALELDPAGRRRWLEALSAEYRDLEPALRRALLPEGDGASRSEEAATLPNVGAGVQPTSIGSGPQAGEAVGPYRLIRLLGAGGMAEVWLAQRADGAFKREVALKLPMLSRARKDLASRFARECDILAGLEHSNIARLYDAGVNAEGLPYLAMECVHGEPLTAWCNAHRLGIRERLKLFLQVLDAVQYAHGHQVIHRDIKPSNILVNDSGQVRLLDFGVAKLLAHEDEQTELTQIYGRALTPEYASPELVRGDAIDAVADVYSLGVVLYELLCGNRPYRLKGGASMALLEQAIATAQVERPSTQLGQDAGTDRSTTQDKLAKRLRGDLDAIVLKALAKRPEDRYGSAAALADDLQRYLIGDTVEARPDSLAYRAGKFVMRHRAGVARSTTATLVVALAIAMRLFGAGNDGDDGAGRAAVSASTGPFSAPAHSVAVLPFVNMSDDPKQEYFAQGLSEELLNSLASVRGLQVAARTSSFAFRSKDADVAAVARKLNVGAILEGSVRRDGAHVRITAQLINAVTGFHLWSQTYDRDLKNLLGVQTEIASAVAKSLQVTLLTDSTAQIEMGGSKNPLAIDAYIRGCKLGAYPEKDALEAQIAAYSEAISLDPRFAKAYVLKAQALTNYASRSASNMVARKGFEEARAAAVRALELAPELSSAHAALAYVLEIGFSDLTHAEAEYELARALSPNSLFRLGVSALFYSKIGRADVALAEAQRAVVLDPLNAHQYIHLGIVRYQAGRYRDAIDSLDRATMLDPNDTKFVVLAVKGLAYLLLGEFETSLESCVKLPADTDRNTCLAIDYYKLNRRTEAHEELEEMQQSKRDDAAYQYAEIYAQWGDIKRALDWLETAYRLHDSQLNSLKGDRLLDPLLSEPSFQEIERKLMFPR